MSDDIASHPAEAYPLDWPEGWPRVVAYRRKRADYTVGFARARDDLLRNIRLLGGRYVVISTNIALRQDGLPYANHSQPADTGVTVYWFGKDKKPWTLACDQWDRVKDNLRAVGLTVEALRMIQRTGASQLLKRVHSGFKALPSSAGAASWRGLLGVDAEEPTKNDVDVAYREKARSAHPDRGGSHDEMIALNAARDQAMREVGP